MCIYIYIDMYMTDLYTYILNLEFVFNRNLYTTIVKKMYLEIFFHNLYIL